MIIMKKYTHEEREAAIKEIEEAPLVVKEWEGPNETKVTSLKYVDDASGRKKKGLFSGFLERIRAVLHPA